MQKAVGVGGSNVVTNQQADPSEGTTRWALSMRKNSTLAMVASLLLGTISSHAVTILSGPSFTQSTNAPLAGTLQLTTDIDSRVSILVEDGTEIWLRDFYDFGRTHSIPLLGFKPGRTNLLT